jgi:predicted RNase H-like HicB family nuclease
MGRFRHAAYVPDLPGCVAVGKAVEHVRKLIAEAVSLHLEGLGEHGLPIPDPEIECEYIEVDFTPFGKPYNSVPAEGESPRDLAAR